MSSTAHWLVLSTVATRQKGFIYTETEHLTHAHAPYLDTSICTVREKNMCTCWFRHINSSIKSPPPQDHLLRTRTVLPSISWLLPSFPTLPPIALPFPLPMSFFLCGRRGSIHFRLPKGDRRKSSPRLHHPLLQNLPPYSSSQMIYLSWVEFVKFNIKQGLKAVREAGGKKMKHRNPWMYLVVQNRPLLFVDWAEIKAHR